MSPTGPSNAELVRRLDEVVARLDRLANTLEDAFVRKDVMEAREAATAIQITGLETEVKEIHRRIDRAEQATATNRRFLISSFVAPIVVGVVVVLILASIGLHK